MTYTRKDFSETLKQAGIDADSVFRVIRSWGEAGYFAGWEGGFLVERMDETFTYVAGWCCESGWGCQDGFRVHQFECEPSIVELRARVPAGMSRWDADILLPKDDGQWDEEPSVLNRWLERGAPPDE
jgi:hypothetical protein